MSENFDHYARYYELLYKDKNYSAEADYLHEFIQRHVPGASRILELGCGAGGHAFEFAKRRYKVHGVDVSRRMIERAESERRRLSARDAQKLSFEQADAGRYRADRRFDAVLSLFHVVNYQTRNEQLAAIFDTATRHLHDGGLFLFDSWFGPAVLTIQASERTKKMQDDAIEVTRSATPKHFPQENRIDVVYDLNIVDKTTGEKQYIQETHPMRYLFLPEIRAVAETAGLSLLHAEEWMTGNTPGYDTWSLFCVCRK